MRHVTRPLTLLLAGGFSVGALLGAVAQEPESFQPNYRRGEAPRPAVTPPQARQIPQELMPEADEDARIEASRLPVDEPRGGAAARTRPGDASLTQPPIAPPALPDPATPLEDQARLAARWAARHVVSTLGRVQYYRVGFHQGLRVAMHDESLGHWDYLQGVRSGATDPSAYRMGLRAGARAAEDRAAGAAEDQVAEQFSDLSVSPRFRPRIDLPAFEPRAQWTTAPRLADVFQAYPVLELSHRHGLLVQAFRGWDWDPWRLQDCARYGEFYDAGWRDARQAYSLWRRDAYGQRLLRRLSPAQRQEFAQRFHRHFARIVAAYFAGTLRQAHDWGFEDGWQYGARIQFEWQFRRGYTEGFDDAVLTAARASFLELFPAEYDRAYQRSFDDWSRNPKPGILDVTLRDSNDDGIFQPGESIEVGYRLANFGGGDGQASLRVVGAVTEGADPVRVSLPARAVTNAAAPIATRIRPDTPARTRTQLELRLGDRLERVALWVSYPLEFLEVVELASDNLAGRAAVTVNVINRSRKPVAATVELAPVSGRDAGSVRHLEHLRAAESRPVTFELNGLRPVEMLAGEVELFFNVVSADQVHDGLGYRFPDCATDLGNRDLLDYMVELSRDRDASRPDVAAVRKLMLRRLQVDWGRVARGRGNPYKYDLKRNGSTTAMGDLVQTYLRQRRGFVRPEVFGGLDAEILRLAEELPGTHPFLRKYLKRLARRLG